MVLQDDREDLSTQDELVERLKKARGAPAVAKMKLLRIRETDSEIFVFVFEGIDDKIVYAQWINRVCPEFRYEPLTCDGKRNLLAFRDSLRKDQNGLNARVIFFVDRDFDDLSGREAGDDIFMTDYYSVESYLVSDRVLDQLLKTGFHCDSYPAVRIRVINLFKLAYDRFLEEFKEVNFRIFIARREKIEIEDEKNNLAKLWRDITLNEIKESKKSPEEIVPFARELTSQKMLSYRVQFDHLDPKTRHRGKFAFAFFCKWLAALQGEWRKSSVGVFDEVHDRRPLQGAEFHLGNYASKSALPADLERFLGDKVRASRNPESL